MLRTQRVRVGRFEPSISREDRCRDRLEDDSTGVYEDNTSPSLSTTQFYNRQGRRDGVTEEDLGHDEPSEILGLEYTQRKAEANALVSRSGNVAIELQA